MKGAARKFFKARVFFLLLDFLDTTFGHTRAFKLCQFVYNLLRLKKI